MFSNQESNRKNIAIVCLDSKQVKQRRAKVFYFFIFLSSLEEIKRNMMPDRSHP